jgi:nucleotide-binding universal stress UspA family protein
MDTTVTPPGTIVAGVDGSASAARALEWAIDQAVREHRPLTLAHAVDPTVAARIAAAGADPVAVQESLQSDANATLARARTRTADRAPELVVHEVTSPSDPRVLLLDLAKQAAAVVVGSRGRGPLASLLLGSVGAAVVRQATCPVVVVRPGNPGVVRNGVLVGIDGTEQSLVPLEFAYQQASLRRLPLTVMHCFGETGSGQLDDEVRLTVSEILSGLGEKFPDVRTRVELAGGAVAGALVQASRRMDVVVLGAHHGSALGSVMAGSVAISVLEQASCPVAIVPTTMASTATGGPPHEHQ